MAKGSDGTAQRAVSGPAWLEFGLAVLLATDVADATGRVAAIEAARAAFAAALDADDPFGTLVANAALGARDAEVLALLASAEADWALQRLVGQLNGDANRNRIPLGLLAVLFADGGVGALSVAPDGALRRAELVDVLEDGAWADQPVRVHPAVVWALLGDDSIDPGLPRCEHYEVPGHQSHRDPLAPVVVVTGPDRMRRRAAGAALAYGDRFMCVDQPASQDGWAAVVREATITGQGVIVELGERLDPAGRRAIERARHVAWVLSSPHAPVIEELPDRTWRQIETDGRDAPHDEWLTLLGDTVPRNHRLTLDQLHRVARVFDGVGGDLDAAVRRLAAGQLDQLTRRIRPTRKWDDIVLSGDRLDLLRSIVDRVHHDATVYDEWGYPAIPSRGLVALFSGPSGTGKTLAAEIVAGELGLDLFKLDLSSVVSKYIGETEKHLDQLFDAAGAGNSVLFFDEADSLFGKRSEVKDARDRYANIEVSYLLQRLEAYDGVVVLATNFEKNVDEAFLRRIHVRIDFAMPGPGERERIWRQAFPPAAPLAPDVDFGWFARQFEIAGGAIRNASVSAGFIAASAGTLITSDAIVAAVAREYRKLGRLITAKDFGEHHAVADAR